VPDMKTNRYTVAKTISDVSTLPASIAVAACDVRGKLLGEWMDAKARLVSDADEIRSAYASLHRKYRLQMLIGDFFSKLTGRFGRRQFIAVTLAP